MQIRSEDDGNVCAEHDVWCRYLNLDDADVLELGCGAALLTQQLVESAPTARVTAMEVDEIQHAKNLENQQRQPDALSRIHFVIGGAESIPAQNEAFDAIFMFKSLHHVPAPEMDTALNEIRRVLKPDGRAYISEPIFAGDFNELLRLFHDEEQVRKAAFEAIRCAVADGRFTLVDELFFLSPMHFTDFAEFEEKVIGVSHSEHQLSDTVYQQVRQSFAKKMTDDGAHFLMPMRVDLLEVGA